MSSKVEEHRAASREALYAQPGSFATKNVSVFICIPLDIDVKEHLVIAP